MKLQVLFEDEDRISLMKAMQDKRFSGMRDSLTRPDIAHLVRMVRLKDRKQNPRKGVPDETMETLISLGLADIKGPTPSAKSFLRWLHDNPNREQEFHDKRADADDALRRGHLKRDNNWVDPKQKRARAVIKRLTDDEKEVFRKVYNRYLNKRTKNLAINWNKMPASDMISMQKHGIIDDNGELTDFGVFALNYYTAFKNDPDGLNRVGRERRVGNFGNARRRRQSRLRRTF